MVELELKDKFLNFCTNCNAIVEIGVIFDYTYDETPEDSSQEIGARISLSKCLKCDNPILFKQHLYWGGESKKFQLYPEVENVALKHAPDIVINPYKEALVCYRAQAYEASTIMCRKAIEAICLDKGETNGNLHTKLKNLKDKKIIEETFYSWANELRNIGNDGAHSHDQLVDKEDAKDAIDFLDSLITFLYHLVDKYDKLKLRRNK